jgi:Fe-S-cluster-containing dehydrogenase component
MARKLLLFDPALCAGCLSCQTNCAQRNEGASGLVNARIRVSIPPLTGDYRATICRQCKKAACAEACPVGAITLHADGYWDVDYDTCIGCNECLKACPFGAMLYDPIGDKVMKCHTCQGDPACAGVCGTGALVWIDAADVAARRRAAKTAAQ